MKTMSRTAASGTANNCPLKSLHVGISWSTGGAGGSGRIFADLAQGLPNAGVQFFGAVSFPDDVSEQTAGAVRSFAPVNSGTIRRLRGARNTLCSLIRQYEPDLIASHFALYSATILDKLRQRTHVVHFHGPWAAESLQEGAGRASASAKYLVERAVYRQADRVIVLSRAFAHVAMQDYSVPEEKIRIVPGAVDIDRFAIKETRQQARQSLGWPQDKQVLVCVRRLVSRMGLDRLISAMAIVRKTAPETILYIVGKGRLLTQLQEQVAALDLQGHVLFQGFVPDWQLPIVYRSADLNVVPTLALEGFGLVAIEAIAAGTPSLVTPTGGLPEVVSSLSSDLILRSTSVEDIADGLLQALSGSIKLPDANACSSYALHNFSLQLMASRTAEVYREACGSS